MNIGLGEWIVLGVVLLVFVGPEQLPTVVRRAGQLIGQLRTVSERLKGDFMSSMAEIESAADPRSWQDDHKDKPVQAPAASPALAPAADIDWTSTAPVGKSDSAATDADEAAATVSAAADTDNDTDGHDTPVTTPDHADTAIDAEDEAAVAEAEAAGTEARSEVVEPDVALEGDRDHKQAS